LITVQILSTKTQNNPTITTLPPPILTESEVVDKPELEIVDEPEREPEVVNESEP